MSTASGPRPFARLSSELSSSELQSLLREVLRQRARRRAQELGEACEQKPLEHGYYSGGVRFQVWVTAPDGQRWPLVDGQL